MKSIIKRMTTLAVAACIAMTLCINAQAQESYNFKISESTRVMLAGRDFANGNITQAQLDDIVMQEACQNPSARLHDRNRFAVMLENTSTQPSEITTFTLSLAEAGYEFGTGDIPGDGFAGNFVMDPMMSDAGVSITGATVNPTRTQVTVSFDGLTTGLAALFRLDLDITPSNTSGLIYPDFHVAVLGGTAEIAGGNAATPGVAALSSDHADPASIRVDFESGKIFNKTFDPLRLAGQTFSNGMPEAYQAQSMIEPAEYTVPEPTTAVLCLMGLAALPMRRRRMS